MGGIGELVCATCAAAMVYLGPLSVTLPQGAQMVVTLIDAEREPIIIGLVTSGSTAVGHTLAQNEDEEGGWAVILTATAVGVADVAILASDSGRQPVAMSITVHPARTRIESDGPLTLELVLPTFDAPERVTMMGDYIVPMLAGMTPGEWTEGARQVDMTAYMHWRNETLETARIPTGWRLLFPASGQRLAHGPDWTLWQAPAGLGEWQWSDIEGQTLSASRFIVAAPAADLLVPVNRRRVAPEGALREPMPVANQQAGAGN